MPVRRWVLSLFIRLRFLLAAHSQLLTPVLRVVQRTLTNYILERARTRRPLHPH